MRLTTHICLAEVNDGWSHTFTPPVYHYSMYGDSFAYTFGCDLPSVIICVVYTCSLTPKVIYH
jgi:hypothetical protein